MSRDLKSIYNDFARDYDDGRSVFDMTEIINALLELTGMEKRRLLDLGCGAGVPFAKTFADMGWSVTGLDFSEEMLKLAEKYVPEMKVISGNMAEAEFESESFEVVSAIYSLFHISVPEQCQLFTKAYDWLTPGGTLYFTYATEEYTGSAEFDGYKEFMGRELYYSHTTPEKLSDSLESIGFRLKRSDYREIGGETFLWVCACKQ